MRSLSRLVAVCSLFAVFISSVALAGNYFKFNGNGPVGCTDKKCWQDAVNASVQACQASGCFDCTPSASDGCQFKDGYTCTSVCKTRYEGKGPAGCTDRKCWQAAVDASAQACTASGCPTCSRAASASDGCQSKDGYTCTSMCNAYFEDRRPAGSAAFTPPIQFQNSTTPPPPGYTGTTFQLSYQYPTPPMDPQAGNDPKAPKQSKPFPWVQALNGQPIGPSNALAYVRALKQYISPNMETLLFHYNSWDASKEGWYNQPWLANIREPLYGMYQGSEFAPSVYPGTGLTVPMQTYVLTFYDTTAAYTLRKVWGAGAINPVVNDPKVTQFAEGSVILKLAVTTASAKEWPVMANAVTLPIYIPPVDGSSNQPAIVHSSLMQVDIIVKDTKTAPKTGWVFSTLVYDQNAPGKSGWDRMVPLGAQWGNDLQAVDASKPLMENVINPDAPLYSVQTLGWNGRLSGPNDGSVLTPAYVNGVMIPSGEYGGAAVSSCMSCHGTAEWPKKSFLLPNVTYPPSLYPPGDQNGVLMVPTPGTSQWMNWFNSRPGTQPQDEGTVAFDYDMVFVFKSLPAWKQATQSLTLEDFTTIERADRIRRGLGSSHKGK